MQAVSDCRREAPLPSFYDRSVDPEELTAVGAPVRADLPPDTRMGAVHLTVADLDRSLAYYETQIGLRVHARDDGRAQLGTGGEDLLVLTEEPGARPADGYSGLFHFALLVPERIDLARWLAHAARDRVSLSGLSDHFVSEAIYLRDPDHHGIEIYADRPRELWEGQVERLTTLPLDTNDLLSTLDDSMAEPFDGLAVGTVMGARAPLRRRGRGVRELLPRRRRLRPDGAARRPGRVPQCRRLPPSPRRQHVAERGAPVRAGGPRAAHAADDRAAG